MSSSAEEKGRTDDAFADALFRNVNGLASFLWKNRTEFASPTVVTFSLTDVNKCDGGIEVDVKLRLRLLTTKPA